MRLATIVAALVFLGGCSSLPPILQRWAGLDIATLTLIRDDHSKIPESYSFSEQGLAEMRAPEGTSLPGPSARWRVHGEWLEIDTANDGTFETRMRAISHDVANQRIVVVSATGKKSKWRYTWVTVVIKMIPQRPGYWQP